MPVLPLDSSNARAAVAFLERMTPRGVGHWEWKYALASGDSTPRAFVWQENNAVHGFIGLMRTTLETGASSLRAAWFVDWHVQPGDKAVGIGLGLLRTAERAAGVMLTLQGSPDTHRILPRLGWEQSEVPATLLLPVGSRYIARYLERRAPAGLRTAGSLAARATGWLWRRRKPAHLQGVELVDVPRVPDTYDAVWTERVREFAPALARDSAYLNYLCADYPQGGYRLQLVRWRGATVGHLFTRLDPDAHGFRQGRIVDILWSVAERRLLRWVIETGCWQLDQQGADYVLCTASRPDLRDELRQAGFRVRNTVPIWYHRLPAGTPHPDGWHITYLDCDRAYR